MNSTKCSCSCVILQLAGRSPSSEGVTAADVKENIRRTEIHRLFVYTFGKVIYPEYDFIAHDLSKFSSAELIPYTKKFILNIPDHENSGWEAALQHYYAYKPHFPQYWGAESMPEEYLKESIVDMIAARYQYRHKKEELPDYITLDMLDILQPNYLTRYSDGDRRLLEEELERLKTVDWSKRPVPKIPYKKMENVLLHEFAIAF